MRLDHANYRPGDVVLLDGVECSPNAINYADDESGEVAFIRSFADGKPKPVYLPAGITEEEKQALLFDVRRGRVELQLVKWP